MTEGNRSRDLLAALAAALPETQTQRDIHRAACRAAIETGATYARFDPPDAVPVEQGPDTPVAPDVDANATDTNPTTTTDTNPTTTTDTNPTTTTDTNPTTTTDTNPTTTTDTNPTTTTDTRPDQRVLEQTETVLTVADDDTSFGSFTVRPALPESDVEPVVDILCFGLARVEAATRRQTLLDEQARKVEELHSVAAKMARCTDEEGVFRLAMDAAENILEFDISSLDIVEGDTIVPQVLSTGLPDEDSRQLRADEGIAGQTYQENRSIVVDDLQSHPGAHPGNPAFRSLLSVPIEGHGVFQAGARQVGAFDETDAELADLLMTHVSQSLDRLESAAQLRESEKKYRTLIEQIHDAVAIYRAGDLVFANARAEELVGLDVDELVGTGPAALVHPDDTSTIDDVVDEVFASPDGHATYDVRLRASDGSYRHCECSASRMQYQGESAVLVSVRDITDRKRRQRELERQNERLEEFASVVSHDLRNPLNVAAGSLDLARQTGDDRHFERANDALDRMNDLVDGVLRLARQGQVVDDTERVDLAAVVERAWRSIDPHDATLDVQVTARVDADPVRLQELLENLFRNAVEHGGDAVTVTVSARPSCDGFVVADDGPGLAADERDDVFDRGYSTSAGGTGFGLAIVESIAEAHGWSVRASPAEGARFEVSGVAMF